MPTEPAPVPPRAVESRRVLRLAAGTAFAMFVSQAGGWTLSFIAPVLTMTLLALPIPRPKPKFFFVVVVAMVGSIFGSFIFLPMLLHQPLAGLIVLTLALFHSFYFTARGGAAVVGTLLTIGMTLTVAVGSVSVDALIGVAQGLSIGAVVGAAIAWLSHAVLPDSELPQSPAKREEAAPPVDAAVARRNAMRSMAIVLPLTVWFLLSNASASNAAVMIKVAAMGQEASLDQVRDAARSLLVSTLAGGVAAVIGWQLLTIWPSLTMYVLLIAVAGLLFGSRIFSGYGLHPAGATWSYAFLTMIVILAPAALDSQFGSAAGARFYDRLWMFMGASLYGVVAAYVFDAFARPPAQAAAAEM